MASAGRVNTCGSSGFKRILYDPPHPGMEPKLDGDADAFLVILVCMKPPEGRIRWTVQLLADKLVRLGVIEDISDETVQHVLNNETKPWQKEM